MMKSYKFLGICLLVTTVVDLKSRNNCSHAMLYSFIIHQTDSAVLYIDLGELLTIWFIEV